MPYRKILKKGIIKLKDSSYIKILKVIPINFNLKSDLEKNAILNSYKIFLKTCNFDIQIIIQSNKEDLTKHIKKINEQLNEEENKKIYEISSQYISFISKLNHDKKSSSKNFYIIIKEKIIEKELNVENEELINEQLNEKYFKIKECLSRCGNLVYEYEDEYEIKNVLYSFLNSRMYFYN